MFCHMHVYTGDDHVIIKNDISKKTLRKDTSHTEASHQIKLFDWSSSAERNFPELAWMHHIPNGGARGSDSRSRAIAGNRLKRQGVKSGIPDIFLPVQRLGYAGLYIELKRPDVKPKRSGRGGVSDEQAKFGSFAIKQGYKWIVCYGWEDARDEILNYLQEKVVTN